uniref:Uncharacterized protein n=1 Tax=Anopheles merus TaxID=30066 RepID=A0A182VI01_ANOME
MGRHIPTDIPLDVTYFNISACFVFRTLRHRWMRAVRFPTQPKMYESITITMQGVISEGPLFGCVRLPAASSPASVPLLTVLFAGLFLPTAVQQKSRKIGNFISIDKAIDRQTTANRILIDFNIPGRLQKQKASSSDFISCSNTKNHTILTCFSESRSRVAISMRRNRVRYMLPANSRSSSSSCVLVNAVRMRLLDSSSSIAYVWDRSVERVGEGLAEGMVGGVLADAPAAPAAAATLLPLVSDSTGRTARQFGATAVSRQCVWHGIFCGVAYYGEEKDDDVDRIFHSVYSGH